MTRRYIKKPRCADCGKIVHRPTTRANYKGNFCDICKKVRTAANKRKWDEDRRYKSKLELVLGRSVKAYIVKRTGYEFNAMKNKVETIARLEARRATYGLLLMLGAKTFFKNTDSNQIPTKMMREIEGSLGQVRRGKRKGGA